MSQASHYRYHQHTVAQMGLAGSRPSEHAQALLDERERACGVPSPAAVRERYAQQAGLEHPELYFTSELVPQEGLGAPYLYWSNDRPWHPLGPAGEGRLPVMVEDQGGVPLGARPGRVGSPRVCRPLWLPGSGPRGLLTPGRSRPSPSRRAGSMPGPIGPASTCGSCSNAARTIPSRPACMAP